jgi:hypothetical protein
MKLYAVKNGDGDIQDFRVAPNADDALADHLKETGVEDDGSYLVDDWSKYQNEMQDEDGNHVEIDLTIRGFVAFGPDA